MGAAAEMETLPDARGAATRPRHGRCGTNFEWADWWRSTAANRSARNAASAWDHHRFWDAMHAVSAGQLAEIGHRSGV